MSQQICSYKKFNNIMLNRQILFEWLTEIYNIPKHD